MTCRPTPLILDTKSVKDFPFEGLKDALTSEHAYERNGETACTLARSRNMKALVVCLEEGRKLDDHKAPGPVTINVLSGAIRLHATESLKFEDLEPGGIAVMPADARHSIEALKESSLLVVIGESKETSKVQETCACQ